jgi:serine phosphatase RsbU (regulator of sigma subunit)
MTVSGLHGELERLFSHDPGATPGEALVALNRHAAGVLARHRVYPSALCLRIDPEASTLSWASAGHPPAFVRRAGGSIEALDSTTFLLGVVSGAEFESGEQTVAFGPGDSVLAFTDGASEALNSRGAMLRPQGVRDAMERASGEEGSLAEAVAQAVSRHRRGAPEDDTLIVEVSRPA